MTGISKLKDKALEIAERFIPGRPTKEAPTPKRPASKPSSRPGTGPSKAALPLVGYDALATDEIVARLKGLTRRDLYTIHEYERTTRNRLPILEKVENLLAS